MLLHLLSITQAEPSKLCHAALVSESRQSSVSMQEAFDALQPVLLCACRPTVKHSGVVTPV
jgi:hypothetical protein